MGGLKSIKISDIFTGLLLIISGIFFFFTIVYADKALPGVHVGNVDVGGLTREEITTKLRANFYILQERGIHIVVDGDRGIINPRNIDFEMPFDKLALGALSIGRSGNFINRLMALIGTPIFSSSVSWQVGVDEEKLKAEIDILASVMDQHRKDIRFYIDDGEVSLLYDTKPGKVLNREKTKDLVLSSLKDINFGDIYTELEEDQPIADPGLAKEAVARVEYIIKDYITLTYKGALFVATSGRIASWITSEYEGERLVPGLNNKLISEYVTEIAEGINAAPQSPRIVISSGKAIDFTLPKQGITLLQDETINLIKDILRDREQGKEAVNKIALPVSIQKPQSIDESSKTLGIVEKIGGATTPFTGSPRNRVHNIKNGVKFLTGIIIPPGEEFSTVGALGEVDNTTGYLPELVIKGDDTVLEFGGGLCQVSTTLFRAILDSGLPVTERRNHSYRVPYYERDGDKNFIGPGLDATIYLPKPDLRFRNDTENSILIYGYVIGDKVTFELYGTKDGRKSSVDGPHTLSVTPAPPTVYIETDTLPKGEKRKIDTAHAGGSAVATYTIEYEDGTVSEQEFKSYYRPWPAKYLVGTKE